MHIPDGFISDPRIWVGCALAAGATLALTRPKTLDEAPPLLPAMTAAFLFAAQMFNFPVAGGTSGHLLGGTLACTLLGGAAGIRVTAGVLLLQCLLFQDGGVTALGANVLNMAIAGGGGGWLLFRLGAQHLSSSRTRLAWLAFSTSVGVFAASLLAALEIGLSGVVPTGLALTAMGLVHLPIALAEGLATASIIGALEQSRPELLRGLESSSGQPAASTSRTLWIPAGVGIALLTVLAALFASSSPDGLETVAEQLGFASQAQAALPAPFPDYSVEGAEAGPSTLSVAVALGGTGLVAGLTFLLARLGLRRHKLQDR